MNLGSFSALFILLVIIVIFFGIKQKDGFQTLHVPESPVAQRNLVEGATEDYAPSYVLATGPAPGAVASFNSLPYRDPSQEKANYRRILNVQTTLRGFLDNEAPNIQELSDPAIQLPLSSARSDLTKLRNEVLVLKRNPGIDSSLTIGDLDEIEANLAYLQKKWRMSVYNEVGVEGFNNYLDDIEDMGDDVDASGHILNDASGHVWSDASGSSMASLLAYLKEKLFSGRKNEEVEEEDNSSPNASLKNLESLIAKIDATILKFTASGTTDVVTQARVNVLKQIINKIQAIINDVTSGVRAEKDIPITRTAYNNFLKTVSDVNSPVSKLFGDKVSLADLFPSYSIGDVSGATLAQYLFDKYSDMLFKGMSFNMNINYESEAEQGLASALANTLARNYNTPTSTQQGFPDATSSSSVYFNDKINELDKRYFGSKAPADESDASTPSKPTSSPTSSPSSSSTTSPSTTTSPKKFNWKERAEFICSSVESRGLDPNDFACLSPDQVVSDDFSWRGYAKMVCGRLGTSYDTGLPEVCGCPPPSWVGWKT